MSKEVAPSMSSHSDPASPRDAEKAEGGPSPSGGAGTNDNTTVLYVSKFTWSSLWEPARVNPLNLKSYTIPILNLRDPYARNFHLSWLAFHVAFLSWFAFPPLIPEAIRTDLKLTPAQIGNSNIVALCATLIVRIVVGPLVDRFGPRKVMASLLVIGAIPSGLAGTAHSAQTLYVLRFFIGILGGTFVPCQAWTTAFFDKNCVGAANALVGGWGNAGGGTTFIIMVALFERLTKDSGLSAHSAWRAAFAIVPVPALLFVAVLVMVFGTDHPGGKWSQRHEVLRRAGVAEATPELEARLRHGANIVDEAGNKKEDGLKDLEKNANVEIREVGQGHAGARIESEVDVAVNTNLTPKIALQVVTNPLTWLPALAYLSTFGFELAVDSNLANILFAIYKSPNFGQTKAGYITSTYGLLNFFTRPLGGFLGDWVYKRWGVPGKKYLTLACGLLQGVMALALGFYIDSMTRPDLATVIGLVCVMALFNEMGNGANFSLVPHCNASSNGFMSGIVGASGNLGGIFFALIYRFQTLPHGKATWISGIVALVVNAALISIRVPKK